MKCSELWLREWVNPNIGNAELCNSLTMAGLEVEESIPLISDLSEVYVGEIQQIEKHPDADHLHICKVDVGESALLQIICGADNVKKNMKVVVAKINAILPNGKNITPIIIRGISSQGMLCSATELNLFEEQEGILELPADAPIGMLLKNYLSLEDNIIDISITPNRGDCLSIKGIAREISAITQTPLQEISYSAVAAKKNENFSIFIEAKSACPRYVGRIIKNIPHDATTPIWMKERLRRAGIRCISLIVDVTNYVMIELGQPMHAFDLDTIQTGIIVRNAKVNEMINLLDGSSHRLNEETLVIADQQVPLAIAGVMGGLESSVTTHTKNILLESAYFSPTVVAKQRQFYGLNSDSAYRFERHIDPTIQAIAIERATQLILEIAGGEPSQVIEQVNKEYLPQLKKIKLNQSKIQQILGFDISAETVEQTLQRLNFSLHSHSNDKEKNWEVEIPAYRPDISLPEDLIEEIARLYGYNHIPAKIMKGELKLNTPQTNKINLQRVRQILRDMGLHEIISYSFTSEKLQKLFDAEENPRLLLNPISTDMAVMRTNLWPGLINAFIYNNSRQQDRIRLFEIGTCFLTRQEKDYEQLRLGGLLSGFSHPEQWGLTSKAVDFYDLKGLLQNLLSLFGCAKEYIFKKTQHPALHAGQTAGIFHEDRRIGLLGALHPSILEALDIKNKVYLFELDLESLGYQPGFKGFKEISKFPEIRRDLALIVKQTIPAKDIQDTIRDAAGDWLKEIFIFDLYQGKGIMPDCKSIALALILQHPTRTLVDEEVAELIERVVMALKGKLGAQLRS